MTPELDTLLTNIRATAAQRDQLHGYVEQLHRWQKAINLVARPTLDDVWTRHVLDCAQLVSLLPPAARTLVDLGSGAGLPGLIVAILSPHIAVISIESDRRKSLFQQETSRKLGLASFTCVSRRAEDVPPQAFDVVTARAFAPLPQLFGYCARFCAPDTALLLLKGEQAADEVQAARRQGWMFHVKQHQSCSDPQGHISEIRDLRAPE